MKKFTYQQLKQLPIHLDIVNLLTAIREYKGRQSLFIETTPEVLGKLHKIAMIQSTDASNKIEGIRTTDKRLRELMQNKTTPQSRSEKEITGYRDVLETIHQSYPYITLTPNHILQLHKELYTYLPSVNAGKWKNTDNVITEILEDGQSFIRFQPASAFLTPKLVEDLTTEYRKMLADEQLDPLLLIPCFILDFLSIHPFNDGNGRMSRLLTLLLMYQSNYLVGKYISIEKIIENTKKEYYAALEQSSIGWSENKQDYTPFIKYMLQVALKAYKEFEERFNYTYQQNSSSRDRILQTLSRSLTPLSKADLVILIPEYSQKTIERKLHELLQEKVIHKIGRGRATTYIAED